MRRLRSKLLIILTFETLAYLFGYIYVRSWSIDKNMYLFLRNFQDILFLMLFFEILLCSLTYYDSKYTRKMKFYEGYAISLLLIPINLYYFIEFVFKYDSYLDSQEYIWKKYLNYPIFQSLQNDLKCCGFRAPYDIKSTRCEEDYESGCTIQIIRKYQPIISKFGYMCLAFIIIDFIHLFYAIKFTHYRK